MKISHHFKQFFLTCLSYCYFLGGETLVNSTHCLLPNALWKSPVQQPSLEELEYTVSSSDKNNWKQLHQYEGKVCTNHELTECCMETCREVTLCVCALNRTLEREFKRDYSYIALATAICQERRLPCPSRMIDVFSDTAVITFAANSFNSLPQSTWTDPPEPEYQHCSDLEIIQRGS